MQRAGAAVAKELMRRWPDARRVAIHAGGGANGGDGRIAGEILRAQGRELVDERPDVVIDALLGTGLRGAPREETLRLIEQINAAGVPVLAVDIPSGVDASTGELAGAAVDADVTVTMHGPKVGLAVAPGRLPRRRRGGRGHRPRNGRDRAPPRQAGDPRRGPAPFARRQQVHGGSRPRGRWFARHDRRAGARRPRSSSCRRRLRDDRRAGRVDSGARDARAGGGEAAPRGRLRGGGKGEGAGGRAGSRPGRDVEGSSSAACSPRSSCPRSSTPTRSSGWSPASGRRRVCSPRTRASSRACSGASRR